MTNTIFNFLPASSAGQRHRTLAPDLRARQSRLRDDALNRFQPLMDQWSTVQGSQQALLSRFAAMGMSTVLLSGPPEVL